MGRPALDQGKGADLYRRSLYTFWKRTVPPPAMTTFDAADRSVCASRVRAPARRCKRRAVERRAVRGNIAIRRPAMLKEGGETDEARVCVGPSA